MTRSSWERAKGIVRRAAGRSVDERGAFLDQACAGDGELREQVDLLLRSQAPGAGGGTESGGAEVGDHIGPYRLVEALGEGGFGTVYRAEQDEPIRRQVALKVIKPGMDTRQVVARFEAERQALAMMDHPGIARVFDGGATASGRPYFVMELVDGVTVTDYCDEHRLPTPARLELFIEICQAVQHAHQKGVIHRDLKPTNVMVATRDGRAAPKVIDFGIAKATEDPLTDRTVATVARQLVGTPMYMSPEQVGGELDIDTRADIYSLGVLLYELLTGIRPFEPDERERRDPTAFRRLVLETEPPRPSTRLTSLGTRAGELARRRRTETVPLARALRGDLDWIVMKAMGKDRARRYATASGFASDVRRHLDHEPVKASPPSAMYRLRKLVRRRRGPMAAAAVMAVLLVAGTVGTAVGLVQARQAEALARHEAESARYAQVQEAAARELADAEALEARRQASIAEAVNRFLNEDLLASVAPEERGRDVLVRDVLDAAAASLDRVAEAGGELGGERLVEAAIRLTLARTYRRLGEEAVALGHAERAVALRTAALGPDDAATYEALNLTGLIRMSLGELDEAERLMGRALDGRRRLLGDEHPATLVSLSGWGMLQQERGRMAEAETALRAALDGRRRVLGDDHPDTLVTLNNLALLLQQTGRHEAAMPLLAESLDRRRQVLGEDHASTLTALNNMGRALSMAGRKDEALDHYRQALAGRRRTLGDDHPRTITTMANVASILRQLDRLDEAETLAREALERTERALGPDHPLTMRSINAMGILCRSQGRLDEAESFYREALARQERRLGPDHRETLTTRGNLVYCLLLQERDEEVEPMYAETVARFITVYGGTHRATVQHRERLAGLYVRLGRPEDARPHYAAVIAALRASVDRPAARTATLDRCASLLLTCAVEDLRDPPAALACAERSVAGQDEPDAGSLATLARALHATGEADRAVETQRRALAALPDGDERRAEYEQALAEYADG